MKSWTYIILLLTLPLWAWAGGPASVYITAGQSNADGRALNTTLPAYLRTGYSHLRFANITDGRDGHFSSRTFSDPRGRWAFSDVAAHFLDQSEAQDFYMVKCAYGGSSIALGQTPVKRPVWNVSREYLDTARVYRADANTGCMSLSLAFEEGMRMLVDSTLSRLSQGYDVKAILWHQGESDRRAAHDYYGNLKRLIAYMRKRVYDVTKDKRDLQLPVIIGGISHASKQYNIEVEGAHIRLSQDDPDVYYIDMSDASLLPDRLHFDSLSTEVLGRRMYNVLVSIGAAEGKPVEVGSPASVSHSEGIRIAKWKDNLEAAVSYTFDDGYRDHYTLMRPVLKRLGIPVTLGINGGKIDEYAAALLDPDTTHHRSIRKWPRLTWSMVRKMGRDGHEITSHGWHHQKLERLSGEALRYEVEHSDSVIYSLTGQWPRTYIYPYNAFQTPNRKFVEKGRVATRVRSVATGGGRDAAWFSRWLEQTLLSGCWSIGMTHCMQTGYDPFADPQVFFRHLEEAASLRHRLWIGTFYEVAAYEAERDHTSLSVQTAGGQTVITPSTSLSPELYHMPLTVLTPRPAAKVRQGGKRLKVRSSGEGSMFDISPFDGPVTVIYK